MMLSTPADCCTPCPTPITTDVPGPQGAAGAGGVDGTDGLNAYSQLVDGFNMPAFGADTPSLAATSSAWMVLNQIVRVQVAGDMRVISKADATHVVLRNIATATLYPDNIAPASVIAPSMNVSPSGLQGAAGAAGSTVVFPTTTKGDLIVDDGVGSPHVVRLASGTDGQVVAYDAVTVVGVNKVTIAPNAATDNAIARFNGTAGKPVPVQDSAMLVTDSGDLQISTGNAKGTNATDLQTQRSNVAMVASGARAAVGGGSDNTGGGANATIPGGLTNTTSASFATIGGGSTNVASAQGATVPGGESNTASGVDAIAMGNGCVASGPYSIATGKSAAALQHGQHAHSGGIFAVVGDCQMVRNYLRNATTNATPTQIFLDGASLKIAPPTNSTMGFQGHVVGRQDNGDSAMWNLQVLVRDLAGLVIVAQGVTLFGASAGCAGTWGQAARVVISLSGANLIATVTGEAATNIRWQGYLIANSVIF